MTTPTVIVSSSLLTIERLDDLVDTGAPITSRYAEMFWLPTIGPSALWLLRHAAAHTVDGPYVVDIDTLARSIGVGVAHGAHSPIGRTLRRLVDFRCATGGWAEGVWRLRSHLPQLTARQVDRLPLPLRVAHDELIGDAR